MPKRGEELPRAEFVELIKGLLDGLHPIIDQEHIYWANSPIDMSRTAATIAVEWMDHELNFNIAVAIEQAMAEHFETHPLQHSNSCEPCQP